MDTESIAKSTLGKLYIKVLAAGMESRFRYRFFGPMKILRGADILPGQTVLEVGFWRNSCTHVAPDPAFTRNAPRPESGREPGSVAANSWLVAPIDRSIRIIYGYQQTERRAQFQAILIMREKALK